MYWLYRFLHGFEPIEEEVGGGGQLPMACKPLDVGADVFTT